jgi:pentatricopeptide repeat protein
MRIVRRRHSLALVLIALLIGACAADVDPLRERNEEANALFEAGDFEGALAIYQEMLAERPDIDQLSYNAGNALHRLQEFDRAADETQRALPPIDPGLGVSTYYSLGNHLLALGRLDEAYLAYRNALLLDSGDQDSKHNLELSLLMINQRDNPSDPGEGPGPGQEPGGTPQAGEPTPGAPGGGTPGADGSPEASGTPQPGEGNGTPQPDPNATPGGEGDPAQDQAAIQRALEEALAGIDEELTFEEAVRILDLLRQQRERQVGDGGDSSGPDY